MNESTMSHLKATITHPSIYPDAKCVGQMHSGISALRKVVMLLHPHPDPTQKIIKILTLLEGLENISVSGYKL